MGREKIKKEDGGIESLKLTATQVDLITNMQAGYELRDNLYMGLSYFALYKEGELTIPVNRQTVESLFGRGYLEPTGKDKNVTFYRLSAKGEEVSTVEA